LRIPLTKSVGKNDSLYEEAFVANTSLRL